MITKNNFAATYSKKQIKNDFLKKCYYDKSKSDPKKQMIVFLTKSDLICNGASMNELLNYFESIKTRKLFNLIFHTENTLFIGFQRVFSQIEDKKQFHCGGQNIFAKQLIASAFSTRIRLKFGGEFAWFWIENAEKQNGGFQIIGIRENNHKIEHDESVKQETMRYQKKYMLYERSKDDIKKTYQFEDELFGNFAEKYSYCNNIGDFIKMVVKLQNEYSPWIHNKDVPNPYKQIKNQKLNAIKNKNNKDYDENDEDEDGDIQIENQKNKNNDKNDVEDDMDEVKIILFSA